TSGAPREVTDVQPVRNGCVFKGIPRRLFLDGVYRDPRHQRCLADAGAAADDQVLIAEAVTAPFGCFIPDGDPVLIGRFLRGRAEAARDRRHVLEVPRAGLDDLLCVPVLEVAVETGEFTLMGCGPPVGGIVDLVSANGAANDG